MILDSKQWKDVEIGDPIKLFKKDDLDVSCYKSFSMSDK